MSGKRDGWRLGDMQVDELALKRHERYLFAVAYRLLGIAADAEDAVQEAFLRLHGSPAELTNLRGWLTTTVSRICLDMLRSARARRESYVGPWLPEPLVGYDDSDLGDRVALTESLRPAVLIVLEQLSPAERVAFVLHDVFGMDFDRLAEVVNRTPGACRKLASRARNRVRADAPPRSPASRDEVSRVLDALAQASRDGDVARLVNLLDPDVVIRSDGGGVVRAARRPVRGAQQGAALIAGLERRYPELRPRPVVVGGAAGFLLMDGESTIRGVVQLEVAGGRLVELNIVLNPAKLTRATG
jgi:RNA polymerase sigma-70 factor (ECF subfamily)